MVVRCRLKILSQELPNASDSYPEWQNFQFAPNIHYGFVFLHTLSLIIALKHLYALFYQYNPEIYTFSVKKCLVWLLPTTLASEHLAENDIKNCRNYVKNTFGRHAQVVLHPLM